MPNKSSSSFDHHRKRLMRLHRHPFIVPVITFLVLFIISAITFVAVGGSTIGPSDSHIVHLYVDGKEQIVPSRAATVGDLLQRTDIKLAAHDVVEPAATTTITDDNFSVNVYRAHPVTIVDSGGNGQQSSTISTYTAQSSPLAIAKSAGYTVYPEDKVQVQTQDNVVTPDALDQHVVIERAKPVFVNLYGTQINIRTQGKTVAEVLADKKIKPLATDTVTPALTSPITDNSQIFVLNKDQHIVTKTVIIPNDTQTIQDPTLAAGTTVVQQAGNPGQQLITYELDAKTGQQIGNPIQQVLAVAPVTQINRVGTKVTIGGDKGTWLAGAGISPADYNAVDYIVGNESGWCPTKWQGEHSCTTYHGTPGEGLGYGLCQATPGSKMSTAGGDWATNPVTQLEWCTSYANRSYGGWQGAYQFWVQHHWW